jgi:hypothetical protein
MTSNNITVNDAFGMFARGGINVSATNGTSVVNTMKFQGSEPLDFSDTDAVNAADLDQLDNGFTHLVGENQESGLEPDTYEVVNKGTLPWNNKAPRYYRECNVPANDPRLGVTRFNRPMTVHTYRLHESLKLAINAGRHSMLKLREAQGVVWLQCTVKGGAQMEIMFGDDKLPHFAEHVDSTGKKLRSNLANYVAPKPSKDPMTSDLLGNGAVKQVPSIYRVGLFAAWMGVAEKKGNRAIAEDRGYVLPEMWLQRGYCDHLFVNIGDMTPMQKFWYKWGQLFQTKQVDLVHDGIIMNGIAPIDMMGGVGEIPAMEWHDVLVGFANSGMAGVINTLIPAGYPFSYVPPVGKGWAVYDLFRGYQIAMMKVAKAKGGDVAMEYRKLLAHSLVVFKEYDPHTLRPLFGAGA